MTVKLILKLISMGLFLFLLSDSVLQIDFAATKNNGLTNSKKEEIDELDDIKSVKIIAKENLDVNRNNFRETSRIATRRFWLILTLLIIQIYLWTTNRKFDTTSN